MMKRGSPPYLVLTIVLVMMVSEEDTTLFFIIRFIFLKMGFFSSLTCRPRKWNAVMATNVKHAMTLVAMVGIASKWMQQNITAWSFR